VNILSIIMTIFVSHGEMLECKIPNSDLSFYRSSSLLSQTKTYTRNGYFVKEHPSREFGWVSISKKHKTFTMEFNCKNK
jgi:hypothetical protein